MIGQLGYPCAAPVAARRIERHRRSPADILLVAQEGDAVVGLAALHVSIALEYERDAGKLSAIVVDKSARGRGIGRTLVEAVEREACARGCELLFLTTNERRRDAHVFHGALGFEETGRRFAKSLLTAPRGE